MSHSNRESPRFQEQAGPRRGSGRVRDEGTVDVSVSFSVHLKFFFHTGLR